MTSTLRSHDDTCGIALAEHGVRPIAELHEVAVDLRQDCRRTGTLSVEEMRRLGRYVEVPDQQGPVASTFVVARRD